MSKAVEQLEKEWSKDKARNERMGKHWENAQKILRLRAKRQRKREWRSLLPSLIVLSVVTYFLPVNLALALIVVFLLWESAAGSVRWEALTREFQELKERDRSYGGVSLYDDLAFDLADQVLELEPGSPVTSAGLARRFKLKTDLAYELLRWLYENGYVERDDEDRSYYLAYDAETTKKALKQL